MPNETYDLMLVLSANADGDRRSAIAAEAEALIAKGGGTVAERTEWGERPLAFDIEHEATGEYRIIRFEAPGESLEAISRQLNITDQLLRHRIVKAVPGAPATVAASPSGPSEVPARPAAPAAAVAEPSTPAPAEGATESAAAPPVEEAAAPAVESVEATGEQDSTGDSPDAPAQ